MGAGMQRTVIEPVPGLRTRFKMRIDKDGATEERTIFRFHLFNTVGESAVFEWLVDDSGERAAPLALIFKEAAVARADVVFNAEKLFYVDRQMTAEGRHYADIWLHESLLPRRLLDETPLYCGTELVRVHRRFQVVGLEAWFDTVTDPRTEKRILQNTEVNDALVNACSQVADLPPTGKNDAWL